MNALGITVVVGLLVGTWAQVIERRPLCDSPEAEEAALVARDHLNVQHTHGYKYDLNRIEDIKVHSAPNGDDTYVLEVDLLETNCHVLDPTPLANCTVRPKHLTAVEGDCDVVLKRIGGVLTVIAFKCKTEESREDLCVGCPTLLPLNDTGALDFVHASLATFNNITANVSHTLLEVGRISSQIVSGGPQYLAEYVIVEANCTDGACVPLNDTTSRGFCIAEGRSASHTVDCKMFSNLMTTVDTNTTSPPVVHVHQSTLPHKHGLRHHKLTAHHNPHLSNYLSAESAESNEIVPTAPPAVVDATVNPTSAADPAPAADAAVALDSSNSDEAPISFRFKRDVPAVPVVPLIELVNPTAQGGPVKHVPVCPGKVRFFR